MSVEVKPVVPTSTQMLEKGIMKVEEKKPLAKMNESRYSECASPMESRTGTDSRAISRTQTGITAMTNTSKANKLAAGVRFDGHSKALSKRKIKALREKTRR